MANRLQIPRALATIPATPRRLISPRISSFPLKSFGTPPTQPTLRRHLHSTSSASSPSLSHPNTSKRWTRTAGWLVGVSVLGSLCLLNSERKDDLRLMRDTALEGILGNRVVLAEEHVQSLKDGGVQVLDPTTSLAFPLHITPSSTAPRKLRLVGLGVRTVSFLRVRVYVVGFYVDEEWLQKGGLKGLDGWEGFEAKKLLDVPADASKKVGQDAVDAPVLVGEKLMKKLLEQEDLDVAIRIVPTRSTDFGHLRDGFYRAIMGRMKVAGSELSDSDGEEISKQLFQLKSFFPPSSVPKGKSLILTYRRNGDLVIEYEGKVLGVLQGGGKGGEGTGGWIGRELVLAYFADKGAISEKAKESVAKGFEEIVGKSSK